MIAVLTGDIIDSRKEDSSLWMPILEKALKLYSNKFDIFRGDSFQAEVPLKDVFYAIFYIKAALMRVKMDARIGLGIGEKDVDALHVKHSFGSALLYSGEAFEALGKERLHIKSANVEFDGLCHVMLSLVIELSLRWTPNMAEVVMASLLHPAMNQVEIAKSLNRKYQSQVSVELQKAAYPTVKSALDYCTAELLKL
ncbi:hypothetical protein [Sphingobacterium sp. MYb382]|uniref:hypothetical protein n=1 Tax=Sphingobacterium sp. MYb382 TaxID=2745278 RepID=UPI0030A3EA75